MSKEDGSVTVRGLEELLPIGRVRVVDSGSKEEILSALADSLSTLVDPATLKRKILSREKLMSTGIGLGLAIPHARLDEAKGAGVAAVLVRGGVQGYESLDSRAVKLVVMIVAGAGQHVQHLKLLSQISGKLKAEAAAERIFGAATAEELRALLVD